MSNPQAPQPAKLIFGLIYADKGMAQACWEELEAGYGTLDFLSAVVPFDYTGYYEQEMGIPLFRRWGTLARLIPPDQLVAVKLNAYVLENQWAVDGKRRINLDPGLLSAERLVLATGKNYTHRLYLGRGIYGDLTLIFSRGTFQPLPWTYPDYRDPEAIDMFNRLRERYLLQLRQIG